ncbi:Puromycin N-acetyltransferase [Lachnellula occidentalis]|uniref:Puromycin N-acetyltransferase n=1 Tax=Lachnellula occidentalis TaxID=215460 RepID=A0A8H8RRR1_9HELO|nr:Puromycin N-acetyltransferase [Lachnellula occidentalis]
MSNFTLSTATISDTPELGHLMALAYQNDPIQRTLMPFAVRGPYWGAWLAHDFSRAGEMYYKITDVLTSQIVAFAKVRYPAPVDSKGDFAQAPPEGTDVQTLMHWFEQMDACHKKHASYEEDYYLNVLCVHPSYQRQGLGKMLLSRFLADADKEHKRAYLQATALGRPLYVKCGWVDVEDMVTQTPEGPVVWKCMMREPGAGGE